MAKLRRVPTRLSSNDSPYLALFFLLRAPLVFRMVFAWLSHGFRMAFAWQDCDMCPFALLAIFLSLSLSLCLSLLSLSLSLSFSLSLSLFLFSFSTSLIFSFLYALGVSHGFRMVFAWRRCDVCPCALLAMILRI